MTQNRQEPAGPDLPSAVDVVVIGAGLWGAATAYWLCRMGAGKVLLVDQAMPGGGDSGRTFGMIRHHYSNDVTAELAIRGSTQIRDWAQVVGVGDAGYVRTGFLLAVPERLVDACAANSRRVTRLGMESAFIGPEQIQRIEPLLSLDGIAAGAYEPEGGFANPTLMILGWIAAAGGMGLTTATSTTVERILVRGGQATGIQTSRGDVSAGAVVVANGAWARPLLGPLGWDPPIRLRRVDVSVWRVARGQPVPSVVCADGVSGLVVRPDRANEFWAVGYASERDEDTLGGFDYGSAPRHDRLLQERFRVRFPALAQAEPVRGWAGPYDFTPDWHPLVGPVPGVDGLHVATASSGHGFKLSPAVGECVAAMALGQRPPIDVSELAPDRFVTGRSRLKLAYGPTARA
jgi:glycine/D-amino acid oxidase-like deaminating enzyme